MNVTGERVDMTADKGARAGLRYRALLIEADEPYRVVIAALLRLAGCQVELVRDTAAALPALEGHQFDLVVWGAPSPDPDLTLRDSRISELRLRTPAPLILLAAGFEGAQQDLEAGADQWLPKPFVPGALVGALRAALRSAAAAPAPVAARLVVRGLVLDGDSRTATFRGVSADFTHQEWDLLSILVNHPNRYLTTHEIVRLGWRAGEHGPEQRRTYWSRLRRKLRPLHPPCDLLGRHGHGYCLLFA